MSVREMKQEDLDAVVMIEQENFITPWRKQDFLYEMTSNPFAKYYVLEFDKICGFIGIYDLGDQIQITNVAVKKSEQGKGYSKLLMDHIISDVLPMNLEVRVSNNRAIHLYESYGFKTAALRKDYYIDNHEDAYLMIREVK